jgi:hypothetical protein
MKQLGRLAVGGSFCLFVAAASAPTQAAGRPGVDPDWPCQQPKVAAFPLASVWDGPAIDLEATNWRDDPEIAALAGQMAQRRAPIAQVQAAVAALAASSQKQKIAKAFAAAFDELVRQRAEVLAGLDRYGRKVREMAASIRAENETAHASQTPDDAALQKLQWDLRVYNERRRTIAYVCEAPQAIEARIGALVKVVRPAL